MTISSAEALAELDAFLHKAQLAPAFGDALRALVAQSGARSHMSIYVYIHIYIYRRLEGSVQPINCPVSFVGPRAVDVMWEWTVYIYIYVCLESAESYSAKLWPQRGSSMPLPRASPAA